MVLCGRSVYDWMDGFARYSMDCTLLWRYYDGLWVLHVRQLLFLERGLSRSTLADQRDSIFQSALNYLVDTFSTWGASAIAANTFLRSVCACAFPLIIPPMYHSKLGIPLATSIFGALATLAIPIPYVFWIYGPAIRQKGKYSAHLG